MGAKRIPYSPCYPRNRRHSPAAKTNAPEDGATRMIRPATAADTPMIAYLIRALAEYERLTHQVVLEEDRLREHLFGPRPFAEVLLAEEVGAVVGFALFIPTFSTFLGKPGLYL